MCVCVCTTMGDTTWVTLGAQWWAAGQGVLQQLAGLQSWSYFHNRVEPEHIRRGGRMGVTPCVLWVAPSLVASLTRVIILGDILCNMMWP